MGGPDRTPLGEGKRTLSAGAQVLQGLWGDEGRCHRRFSDTKFCLQNPPSEHLRYTASHRVEKGRPVMGEVEGVTALLRRNGLPPKEGRAPEGSLPPRSGCWAGGTGVCRGAGAAAHAVRTTWDSTQTNQATRQGV